MVRPTQLDPTEQDALVKQIGLAMLRAAPEDWERVRVDYRGVGRYSEVDGEVVYSDGEATDWPVPPEIAAMFTLLRAGMYRDGRGTWFNAHYRLDHPSSYNLDYDREEPQWQLPPPPQAYGDDLRTFPRTEENIPDWLRRRLGGQPPSDGAGPRFRVARIFDGMGGAGRPMVNRPPVDDGERTDLLDYLDAAPVVSLGRGLDADRLDPEGRPVVPVAFHTDGVWIWPAAVNYYLRNYGVAPEPDLVEHIRGLGFQVPHVDEATRAAADVFLKRPAPPPPAPPAPVMPAPPPPVMPALVMPAPPAPAPAALPPPAQQQPRPPAAALPSQGPPGLTIDHLRARLTALGAPGSAYQIGPPADRTWTMERTADGWRVGWYEREFVAPAMFEDVADAAAFLLGKIMLDTGQRGAPEPVPDRSSPPPPLPEPPPPAPDRSAAPTMVASIPPAAPGPSPAGRRSDDQTLVALASDLPERSEPLPVRSEPEPRPAARQNVQQNAAAAQRWPIQPLPGEPPLTLFRGKRIIELPPGTELDRFGDPDGNLTYAAGTRFSERSLVPEWINRSYHTYRVAQPIQAITGTAIPWFEQAGGGIAFLLSDAVEDLLADGLLHEVNGRRPPPQ